MNHDFWQQRWQDDSIGFHQSVINARLKDYWSKLEIQTGAPVFVPLCGKSLDMLWLAERHPVLGVELSPKAVEGFFVENALRPSQRCEGAFSVFGSGGVTLYCGDFFDLQPATLQTVAAVYDRAALIALPPPMRRSYAEKLTRLLPSGVSMLLLTVEYDQMQMDGPPFAVEAAEVEALFAPDWQIESLHHEDILNQKPKFRDRGLSHLAEHIYLLIKQ